ncbi:MAG: dTMP kinase [Planctomycetaceae bacterium]|nr:dTMP kinase [Planctomycetaceae bacterium]
MSELADKLLGRFIVIDGPDGAGKGTQIGLLGQFLQDQGVSLCRVRDPGGTAVGDRIRQILLDNRHGEMVVPCELMLYMASRAQLAAEVIRPALAAGQCVLSDRYISSTIAYQGAGGADVDVIRQVARAAVGDAMPDLTIILDLDAELGLRRTAERQGKLDRMESKGAGFHRKVRQMFQRQVQDDPAHCAMIDASGDIEATQQLLRDLIARWRWA